MKRTVLRLLALLLTLSLLCACNESTENPSSPPSTNTGGESTGGGNTGNTDTPEGPETPEAPETPQDPDKTEESIVIDKTHPDYLRDTEIFGTLSYGEKNVVDQRAEIRAAMEYAKAKTVEYTEHPYDTQNPEHYVPIEYRYIKAITYDGLDYMGKTTKNFAYFGLPEGASESDPVPAIVLVHGAQSYSGNTETGGHAFLDWVKYWNDRGYAAIAVEVSGSFPKYPGSCINESTSNATTASLSGFFEDAEDYTLYPSRSTSFTKESLGTYTEVSEQFSYHAMAGIILAHNILRQDARIDNTRIGITGISWGGVLASMVIGYDNRYAFAMPVYGTAYLGTGRPFGAFGETYVDALWGAAHNLHNANMPILWLAWIDDVFFCMEAYSASFMHTLPLNDKTTLAVRINWNHSHNQVYKRADENHSVLFANSICFQSTPPVRFASQPVGRIIETELLVDESVDKSTIRATLYYVTSDISHTAGEWQEDTDALIYDTYEGASTLSRVLTNLEIKGYFINVEYVVDGMTYTTTSRYVPLNS